MRGPCPAETKIGFVNIADMAVSLGAFLLAWVLWGEDAETERVSVPARVPVAGESRELS